MPKIADIEPTPNPNAVKFILREPLSWGIAHSFENAAQAHDNPLASALFAIEHVTNVFYVDRWVTVTQDGTVEWEDLAREVAVPIRAAPAAADQSAAAVFAARESFEHLSEADQQRLLLGLDGRHTATHLLLLLLQIRNGFVGALASRQFMPRWPSWRPSGSWWTRRAGRPRSPSRSRSRSLPKLPP